MEEVYRSQKPTTNHKASDAVTTMSRESRAKEAIDILQVLDWKGLKADANTDASRLNIYTEMKGLKEDIGRARKLSTFITKCRRKECSLVRPYLLTSLRCFQNVWT